MRSSALTGAAAAVAALAIVVSGCGSDTKTAASSSSQTSSSSSATTSTASATPPGEVAAKKPTIADYIKDNAIQETGGVKMGDPDAPAVNLPVPEAGGPFRRRRHPSTPTARSSTPDRNSRQIRPTSSR